VSLLGQTIYGTHKGTGSEKLSPRLEEERAKHGTTSKASERRIALKHPIMKPLKDQVTAVAQNGHSGRYLTQSAHSLLLPQASTALKHLNQIYQTRLFPPNMQEIK